MSKGTKKILAVILAIIIIGVAAWAFWPKGYEKGVASLDDLLGSSSTRRVENMPVLVSAEDPYLTLIATPVALYYDGQTQKASPLLVVCPHEPSRGVIRFLDMYGNPPAATLGEVPAPLSSYEREWEDSPMSVTLNVADEERFTGSLKEISLNVAKHFWSHSDGVIIVGANQESYNTAVVVLPLASYLNIPVIVIDKMEKDVADVLKGLGVRYSIVCSGSTTGGKWNVEGYEKTKRFANVEEAQNWMIKIVKQRLGSEVINYITMANPMDIYKKEVEDSFVAVNMTEWGKYQITHSPATAYPGRPEMGEGPCFPVNIPYKYANVKIEVNLDISKEVGFVEWLTSQEGIPGSCAGDDSGARIYVFFGVNLDDNPQLSEEKDKIQFFGGSPGYGITGFDGDPTSGGSFDGVPNSEYAHFKAEFPIFNDVGEHAIQLLAKIPTDDGSYGRGSKWEADYTLKVTVEDLSSYIYPRIQSTSSLAGYLTAYHKGVVLAKPSYMLYSEEYVSLPDSSNPAANLELIEPTNKRVGEVKKELNELLARLPNPDTPMPTTTNDNIIALADYYNSLNTAGNFTYLGIIADPSMVPHYYYPSKGLGQDPLEGWRVPSDNIYSDIDADLDLPPYGLNGAYPRLELADGRITGFDVQDVSATLSRTFFYHDIIKGLQGPWNGATDPTPYGSVAEFWADSGFTTIGTEPPVGPAQSAARKLSLMWEEAEFSTKVMPPEQFTGSQGARQRAAPYYESANFIFVCAHGFYYWYVPTGIRSYWWHKEVGAGGAFDVAHVKLMNFGPSVIWTDSCVTGRIDGLDPRNCLSHAFLHAGFNCYLGGTRSMWGSLFFTPDSTSGEKLGSLMALYWYSHMCGKLYNKTLGDGTVVFDDVVPYNLPTGAALMLAKNKFIVNQGTDGGDVNDDTYEEVLLHGDPAFNPYEPNHEGGGA